MILKLHTVSGAPRGWRVLLGLAFKELPAQINYLSKADGDLVSEKFLKMNPRATVPVLETDVGCLKDSLGILAWLDREYPKNPLFGKSAIEAGEIWQLTMECCDYLREAIDQLLKIVFSSDGLVPAKGSVEFEELQLAASLLHAESRFLNSILADGRNYLCGDEPTAVDAVAYPEIRLVQRAIETKFDLMSVVGFGSPENDYPNLASWLKRLNDDPRVIKTMPIHWS